MRMTLIALAVGLSLLAWGNVWAQGSFSITRYVYSAGGRSEGGGFTLNATMGQPLTSSSSGGAYSMSSGYWVQGIESVESYRIMLPAVQR